MILYIITETEEKYNKGKCIQHKYLFEEITGDVCLTLHYSRLSTGLLKELSPWAIVHSGTGTNFNEYDVLEHADYNSAILNTDIPQLGICGGHQIIATAFGSTMGPMRKLSEDEPDYRPEYNPGFFKESGMYPVDIVKDDPLFQGLGPTVRVTLAHYWEITNLSDQLILLASTKDCQVQVFVHNKKPIYGVQFHPERYTKDYSDGRKILENFFNIAKNFK